MSRAALAGLGVLAGLVFLALMYLLPMPDRLRQIVVDPGFLPGVPLSIQTPMWLAFFVGLAELAHRRRLALAEAAELERRYLPEDPAVLLRADDLPPLWAAVGRFGSAETRILPRLIRRVIRQFQISRSADRAQTVMAASLDLALHEIETGYSMLRYIAWVIPTLGFFGTVVGIALALELTPGAFEGDVAVLTQMTEKLGTAFYTTVLALLMSGVLVFFMHLVQSHEEGTLNRMGQYCLDHLINRLYER